MTKCAAPRTYFRSSSSSSSVLAENAAVECTEHECLAPVPGRVITDSEPEVSRAPGSADRAPLFCFHTPLILETSTAWW